MVRPEEIRGGDGRQINVRPLPTFRHELYPWVALDGAMAKPSSHGTSLAPTFPKE